MEGSLEGTVIKRLREAFRARFDAPLRLSASPLSGYIQIGLNVVDTREVRARSRRELAETASLTLLPPLRFSFFFHETYETHYFHEFLSLSFSLCEWSE